MIICINTRKIISYIIYFKAPTYFKYSSVWE